MIKSKLKYIYGPVYSWRMGMSLGIDPVTAKKKICNFDCIYCQLGRTTEFYNERANFVPVEDIMREIDSLPPIDIDYYTFSGRGEPTLAKNLGSMIRSVRKSTKGKVAVITNAALIDKESVQDDLMCADLVLAKLDACDEASLNTVDIPGKGVEFPNIVKGIKDFKKKFKGKLALQIMFIEENKKYAKAIADVARDIDPDEIQINTPLRPGGTPVSEDDLMDIKRHFEGLPAVTVYEMERRDVEPFDEKETILRHGNFKKKVKAK